MGINNAHFINENDGQQKSLCQTHLFEGTEKQKDHIQRVCTLTYAHNCHITLPLIWAEGLGLI